MTESRPQKKNKQKEALEKLKAMSAVEKIKEELEKDKKNVAGQGASKATGIKIKGNVLSPGTELTGLNRLQHDNYLASLDQQIKQHWFLPQWIPRKIIQN
jgi:colicin import membrane protein